METTTSPIATAAAGRRSTAPGRRSRSTPTAASAATASATQRSNRTGIRELPMTGTWFM